ncbi:tail fiber protein [Rhodopseudomonas sp. G2_2311]|uniref:tail fiber protein n=1 Tax=Rhodopseudomonas sp. G2_2311 TaxID=3114287 RepID=UPI0039C64061
MTLYKWSQVAAANAGADQTCPFPEGMNPAAINDGVRGAMAAVAKYRDDMSGMLVTTGTASAYNVTSNQGFDSRANFHNQVIAFTPHVTNGAGPVTMTVDGFANLPLRIAPGVELPEGTLILGTPYAAKFNNTDGALYLMGYMNSPYNVPLFGGMDYWDTVAPNSSFIFPLGQALSRTVYSKAFARWGTTYGAGDGATTFNAPNKAGRVSVMIEPVASLLTPAYFGGDSTKIGAMGGGEKVTLSADQIPPLSVNGISADAQVSGGVYGGGGSQQYSIGSQVGPYGAVPIHVEVSIGGQINSNGGKAHRTVQPSVTCNYIIRVL